MLSNCNAGNPENTSKSIIHLTTAEFKQKVFNYDVNKQWKYEGTKPAIVDFYADWCGPCRRLAPIIEQVSKEYGDKIVVYKVDTDKEQELAQSLGIQSLPTLLFIPVKGQPQAALGLQPKENIDKIIKELLLTK
jgi:thioredoxin 1